jgi:hypothetical protein
MAVGVVAAGLLFALAYSLPPIRLSGRGALASLLLPAGFVAVPIILGLTAGDAPRAGRNAVLLAGLYFGFIGRILLQDGGMVLVVVAHLGAVNAGRSNLFAAALALALTVLTLTDARAMLRYGPRVRLRLPADMQAGPETRNLAGVCAGFGVG